MSSSTTPIDANDRLLTGWLKQQGYAYKAPLQTITFIALAIFALQLSSFWWLAHIMDTVIVQAGSPNPDSLRNLGLSLVFLLLLIKTKEGMMHRVHHNVCVDLQAKLQHKMEQGGYALVKGENNYFWQQLWLDHIPAVGNYITYYNPQKRLAALTPFIAIAIIWPVNWVVALTLLITIPTLPLFMYLVGKGAANQHRKHFQALSRLGSVFADRVKSLLLLNIFSAHKQQVQVLSQASETANDKTMKVVSVAFLSGTVLDFFSTLAVALVAVFVGFSLLGEINLGVPIGLHHGLFLLLVAPQMFNELKHLGKLYHQKAHAVAAAHNLMPLYNEAPQNVASTGPFSAIHWHDFHLDEPAISAQNITLSKGDWVQLDGPSGSGKTVLLEALMGQRKANFQLNTNVACLNQQTCIKQSSLRENITLQRPVTDEALYQVLQSVGLLQWVETLPNGLDTRMGEVPLVSGGQQQRIAIARLLLSEAEVYILDEPTAHLTDAMHLSIANVLRQNLRGKTVIWASHKSLPQSWFTQHWQMQEGVLTSQNRDANG